jgi:hypothetical protein
MKQFRALVPGVPPPCGVPDPLGKSTRSRSLEKQTSSESLTFPGKVSKMKVVEHLPNRTVGQVLTPTHIPLALPRVGSPKCGLGNFAASTTHTAEACMSRGKIVDIPI